MRTRHYGWKMRMMALVAMGATTTTPLASQMALARQVNTRVTSRSPQRVCQRKPGLTDKLTPAQWKALDAQRAHEAATALPDVHVLTDQQMQTLRGRGRYRSPYNAGTLPWQRSLRDVNLVNGNLFKSFTDIQVAPAMGAGLALQRTYNSNDGRIGPFGIGWTHAYDISLQEENPNTNQTDDTLNYADRADYFGARHKYHRDADGLYSPPPYLYDELDSQYAAFLVSGPIVPVEDTQHSMDGTVKHFFQNGSERDCDAIQDRYGNRTTLSYEPTAVPMGDGTAKRLLSTVSDPSGRTLTFHWTDQHPTDPLQPAWRITQVDGPLYSVRYAYNGEANLQTVTLDPGDPTQGHLNRTTTLGYTSVSDGQGNTETGLLAWVSDPLNHTLRYDYSLTYITPDLQTHANPTGTVWVNAISEPAGVDMNNTPRLLHWTIQPSAWGQQAANGDLQGRGTYCSNDAGLHLCEMVNRYSQHQGISYGREDVGFYLTQYDSADNVVSVLAGTSAAVIGRGTNWKRTDNYTYGAHGNVLSHWVSGFASEDPTDLSHKDLTRYYDASQYFMKQSVTDANGRTTTFGIGDKNGVDPSDASLPAANGNKGSVLWVRDAGYAVASSPSYHKQLRYTYNAAGQKTSELNLNGVATQYTYTDPTHPDPANAQDSWGNLILVVQDPIPVVPPPTGPPHLARTTRMDYDAAGHVLHSTDPNARQSSFTYNVLGQPTSATFAATFDGQGQLVTPAETVAYDYEANGRIRTVTDNRGQTTLAYEQGCDRLHSVTDPIIGPQAGPLVYTYGLLGERQSLGVPGGGTWLYGYDLPEHLLCLPQDDFNRVSLSLQSLTDDQQRRVDYTLDELGRLRSVRSAQGLSGPPGLASYLQTDYVHDLPAGSGSLNENRTHDWISQVQNRWHWQDADGQWHGEVVVSTAYSYDDVGQRQTNQITSRDGTQRTEGYGYDELKRLTSVDYGDGQLQSYSFDAMGNRLTKTDNVTGNEGYGYDAANRLYSRTVGGVNNAYVNDLNGNTLSGGNRINTWDSQNRLVHCVSGANTCDYTYGCDGQRRRSVVNGVTTDFVLDGSMFVRELRNNVPLATYLTGLRGPEYRRDDTTGAVSWYLYDGLGSVLGEVDPNGTVTAKRKYDVYGLKRAGSDAGTSQHQFVGSLGHPTEDETGLIYMRARYMDPAIGRFVSQDPAKNGGNWLSYCDNNPINAVDSTGKVPEWFLHQLASLFPQLLWVHILQHFEIDIATFEYKTLINMIIAGYEQWQMGETIGPGWGAKGLQQMVTASLALGAVVTLQLCTIYLRYQAFIELMDSADQLQEVPAKVL